jgi:hypothetical protein
VRLEHRYFARIRLELSMVDAMDLQAIEFQTNVQAGNIQIPETYRIDLEGEIVKVVVLKTQHKTAAVGIIAQLLKQPIPFDAKPFSREEIYDRNA